MIQIVTPNSAHTEKVGIPTSKTKRVVSPSRPYFFFAYSEYKLQKYFDCKDKQQLLSYLLIKLLSD